MPNIIFNPRENDCYHRLQSCHEELHTTCEIKKIDENYLLKEFTGFQYIFGFDESNTKLKSNRQFSGSLGLVSQFRKRKKLEF